MTSELPVVALLGAGIGGRGVAKALTRTAHLVIVDRDIALAQRAADDVLAADGAAEAVTVDLQDLAAVTAFRDDLLARLGRVDAVIHLVGGWKGSKTVDEAAIEHWNSLVPGIVGTVQTTSVVFRDALMAAPGGRYVMVTSTAVERPTAGNAAYAAAKAAAETWVGALGHSFRQSPARAVIVAVKALLSPEMRAADPDKSFGGYTDTSVLGDTVAEVLQRQDLEPATRLVAPAVAS